MPYWARQMMISGSKGMHVLLLSLCLNISTFIPLIIIIDTTVHVFDYTSTLYVWFLHEVMTVCTVTHACIWLCITCIYEHVHVYGFFTLYNVHVHVCMLNSNIHTWILIKQAPSGWDPLLRGKVIQTIICSKYNMPKDYISLLVCMVI